jgi:hypothetical protein
MKKLIILLLICGGGVSGYWMARQNQKLFELPITKEQLHPGKTDGSIARKSVEIGMDMWQAQEILGLPFTRHKASESAELKKEIWTYEDRRLFFENGVLIREEGV